MPSMRSDRTIYASVLGPLVLAIITLVLVSVGGFQALSAARAYVGGESLWSKARSQTAAHLRERLLTPQAAACQPLPVWLAVPLGDRAARLALEQSPPDLAAARVGFLQGGNHPDDLYGMIHLYLYFGSMPLLREPITAWRRGDELIADMRALGERICARAPGAAADLPGDADLQELERLDAELIAVEKHFSASLGHSSRLTEYLLIGAILLLAVLLAGGSIWFVTRTMRAQIAQRRELLDANTRWDLAADAAGVGVFVWHPATDALELDARARLLYGLSPDPSVPVTRAQLRDLMHLDDRAGFQQLSEATLARNEPLRARYRVEAAGGALRHLEAIGVLREGGDARAPRHMVGVLRDVTDEMAAARLQVERDAAERSAKARSEFLSRLSHELRTPLNAVLGLAQLLDMDTREPLTAGQRARIKLVLESGWHLLHLVDDVLDITSIDSGLLAITSAPTDLAAAIQTGLNLVEPTRQAYAVQVNNLLPSELPQVLGDARRLEQVFGNLLSNACKYNRRGGILTLRAHETPGLLCVRVEDEGRGMSAALLAELFQPFKRLQVTADVPGTGLGLVVVKLLVEQMGGSIEAGSEPGRGTCFTICLRTA
jgi:signal transduction histidine kinase